MSDFTLLFNKRGAIYPLDLTKVPRRPSISNADAAVTPAESSSSLDAEWPYDVLGESTLVHLCAKVIVGDNRLIERAVDTVPHNLFLPLFRAALYPVRDSAIDKLINKWPHKSLILSQFTSTMFSSILTLFNDIEMSQRTRLGVKYSADIVHSFIDALRQRKTRLRYLDISGFPIAEIIVKYVATHCRLAQKEHQRNCLIDEYLQNVHDLESLYDAKQLSTNLPPQRHHSSSSNLSSSSNNNNNNNENNPLKKNDLKKTTSLPDEPLVFKFDCMLQDRTAFEELLGALEANQPIVGASGRSSGIFTLLVAKLDLLCLGKSNIIKLLQRLDKRHIEGLRLQYNSITEESIRDILPHLASLDNLRSLDLSCNLIDYRQNADSCRQMAAVLGRLAHLNRLDLSGSPLGGCLSTLLVSLRLPLEYLALHSCGLVEADLAYLAASQHVQGLQHLDLSENRLTRFTDALLRLLKQCAPYQLYVLELDDNRFDCIDYLTVICVARRMPKLKMLGTKGTFDTNDHMLAGEFLQHSSTLLAWRISYPIDIYDPNETAAERHEEKKRAFLERMGGIVKDKFKLVMSDLFFSYV